MANMNYLKTTGVLFFILFFGVSLVSAKTCNIQCFRYDPVCGVDGKTYGCGLPESNCYGVKIAYSGACKIDETKKVCALSDTKSKKLCATLLEKDAFEKYIKTNITKLSPQKAVLGGTFYVTKIVWQPNRVALVSYEDGHIAFTARVQMAITYNKGQIKSVKVASFKIVINK